MRLRTKLLFAGVVPMAVSLAVVATTSVRAERRALEEGLIDKARSLSGLMVGTVGSAILFNDTAAATSALKQLESDGDLSFALALDKERAVVGSVGKPDAIAAISIPLTLPAVPVASVGASVLTMIAPVKEGERVVGAIVVGLSVARIDAAGRSATRSSLLLALAACLAGAAISTKIGRDLLRRVSNSARAADAVAGGDLTARLCTEGDDEIQRLSLAVNAALERFAATMNGIQAAVSRLTQTSGSLSELGRDLGSSAENTASLASTAAGEARTMSDKTSAVAVATEEMGASVKEIARNAVDASGVAAEAVQLAEQARGSMAKLGEASSEVGTVVKLINAIAEQTNLLALNATIEAARAGDAGKGFAVVANEVKQLARQTARATGDIELRVAAIQTQTHEAASAIEHIHQVIGKVNDHSTAIASAVEEQAATSRDMGGSLGHAAAASAAAAATVEKLAREAQSTTAASECSQTASQELLLIASDLRERMAEYRFASSAAATVPTVEAEEVQVTAVRAPVSGRSNPGHLARPANVWS